VATTLQQLLIWNGSPADVKIGNLYLIDSNTRDFEDDIGQSRSASNGTWEDPKIAARSPSQPPTESTPKPNKYTRHMKGISCDVYDVLEAFKVQCPALQHLLKKALNAGLRGHKDTLQDLNDIIASAERAKALEIERQINKTKKTN
jgi:hypothetical protein